MTVLHIAGVELRRFLRDRSNIFFVFIFPLMLVLLIGSQFGEESTGGRAVVVGAESALRADLVTALAAEELDVRTMDRESALEQVARARVDVALFTDGEAATAYAQRDAVELSVVPSSQLGAQTALQQVQVAVARLSTAHGQVSALTSRGVGAEEAEAALRAARERVAVPRLEVESVDELDREFAGLGQFDLGASGQLLVFVFLASLTGSATLIQARKLGVVARILSAPVSNSQLLIGEALGRFAIAIFQGGYIMAATALLFDVNWGSLWLSLLVLAMFSLVAAGGAMVIGATMDNEGAASGLGVGVGLVAGALGGSMFPLELFPDTMRLVAHATPHAWAYEALADIQRRDGGLLDVLPQLGVLAAMAAGLLAVGALALRRSLGRAM